MKFKIGNRVKYKDKSATILLFTEDFYNKRCNIEFTEVLNVSGTNVRTWVGEDEIELDVEYYRNEKLNGLLNDTN